MDVLISLYDNINLFKKNLDQVAEPAYLKTITKPKKDTSAFDLIDILDPLTTYIKDILTKTKISKDLLTCIANIITDIDKLKISNGIELPGGKEQINTLLVPNKTETYYIMLKKSITHESVKYYEQQQLLKQFNDIIFECKVEQSSDKLHDLQAMGSYAPIRPDDISPDDDIYDITVNKFKGSDTFNIEYNMAPLVNFNEAQKYGPILKWSSGLTEDLVKRYKNIGVGVISKDIKQVKQHKKAERPDPSTCVSKKFYVVQNGQLKKHILFGKNTLPFNGPTPAHQEYSRLYTEATVVDFDLDLEPPKAEKEYTLGKGSYLQVVESLTKAIKDLITSDIPLDVDGFLKVCTDTTTIKSTLDPLIYKLYSNYIGQGHELEVKLCTYEAVYDLTNYISRRLADAITPYIDKSAFLQPPSKRIESLCLAYELGLDSLIKERKILINEKLILLKNSGI
jgi:hypothetical protein